MSASNAPLFKKISLQDRDFLSTVLRRFPQRISGFSFPVLFAWSAVYDYEWAYFRDGTLLFTCLIPAEGRRHLLQPIGPFGEESRAAVRDFIATAGYPVKIFGASHAFLRQHGDFQSCLGVSDDPGLANYIYNAQDLAALAGKFYAKKRNLIAQANRLYPWHAVPLTQETIPACFDIVEKMRLEDGAESDLGEQAALRRALENFAALGLKGILVHAGGEPAAFSVYDRVSDDMAIIHFEKALRRYKGLYQIVNQETARAIAADGVSLINREEDVGLQGLRQAKQSYGPAAMAESLTLTACAASESSTAADAQFPESERQRAKAGK